MKCNYYSQDKCFSACWDYSWEKPLLVAWGISDKYLPKAEAEEFQKRNPGVVKLNIIEGAGHMPQEDW